MNRNQVYLDSDIYQFVDNKELMYYLLGIVDPVKRPPYIQWGIYRTLCHHGNLDDFMYIQQRYLHIVPDDAYVMAAMYGNFDVLPWLKENINTSFKLILKYGLSEMIGRNTEIYGKDYVFQENIIMAVNNHYKNDVPEKIRRILYFYLGTPDSEQVHLAEWILNIIQPRAYGHDDEINDELTDDDILNELKTLDRDYLKKILPLFFEEIHGLEDRLPVLYNGFLEISNQ